MTAASKVYPNHNTSTNAKAVARSSVAVKTAKNAPGNQGTHNSHTKPGAAKPNGTPAQMRQVSSVTTTTPLHNVVGNTKGASNAQALKTRALYPSSHTDTSRKL